MNLQLIARESASTGGSAIQLVILLMIPLAMYFLMIRPQRRRMKETQALQRSLAVDDVQIQIARSAVQGRVSLSPEPAAPAEKPSKSDDA
jgi:hypothetical protein